MGVASRGGARMWARSRHERWWGIEMGRGEAGDSTDACSGADTMVFSTQTARQT